ncbi:hypothetical protein CSA37_07605 [Candidatus Fermentibacteria bacterium]|nr:MAG: hypothetical protein CSA37_07605 [Candidatus Fermentibacteria bacterium]
MDSTLKQMLDGFRFSLSSYASSLGSDNEKLVKAGKLLAQLEKKAESGADMATVTMDPLFGQTATIIGELASEPPLSTEKRCAAANSAAAAIPSASVAAAGYHITFDSLLPEQQEKQKVYYSRIFEIEKKAENAIHFNALLMEDSVLLEMSRTPLIETAEKALAEAEAACSPTAVYQQKLAIETFSGADTICELEFEGTKMAELSNTEHAWDAMYLEVIGLLPGCAQAIESFGPTDDNVAKLQNSHRFMAEFMGITWNDVFKDERYLLFWNHVFWPKVPAEKRAARNIFSAEEWRDMLKTEFYEPFVQGIPARSDQSLARIRFWEKVFPSASALELLETPPRPEITPSVS